MGLPVGIEVGMVTFGSAVSYTGRTTSARLTVRPSARLVYNGTPILDFEEGEVAGNGQQGRIYLPVCDQDGFKATRDGVVVDFTNWSYTGTLTWTDSITKGTKSVTKVFQIMSGQTVIDFDELPDSVDAQPVTAPTVGVSSFLGKTGAIEAEDLTDLGVGGGGVADGGVTTAKLAPDAVTSDKIAAGAVNGPELGQDAVTASKIANDAVARAKLAEEVRTELDGKLSKGEAANSYAPMGGAPSEKARVTFGGIPTMFHDFVGLTDGSAVPTTATSGQPIHWATGYGAVPYFANGSFLAIAPGAAYWCTEDMGENVTHVGGRFVFAPNGGTPGGTMCVAVTDQKMIPANISALNMSVHFWTTYENWAVTVWDSANGGQQVLVDGTYATPLVRDAMTMYDMQAWISGDRGTFILPTGERVYVNDSRFISLTGRFAFVESLLNAGTDDFPCILNATVSTGNTRAPARI